MSETIFTGPVKAGNVLNSNGTGTLAGVGGWEGTANVGYCLMSQSARFVESTTGSVTSIVIPAQSQIWSIGVYPISAFTGNVTLATTTGTTVGSPIAITTSITGFSAATVAEWINTGNTDIQLKLTSDSAGTGVAIVSVLYIQSINNPTA